MPKRLTVQGEEIDFTDVEMIMQGQTEEGLPTVHICYVEVNKGDHVFVPSSQASADALEAALNRLLADKTDRAVKEIPEI